MFLDREQAYFSDLKVVVSCKKANHEQKCPNELLDSGPLGIVAQLFPAGLVEVQVIFTELQHNVYVVAAD